MVPVRQEPQSLSSFVPNAEKADFFESLDLQLKVVFRICERRDLRALEWHGLFTPHRRIIRAAFRAQERGSNVMLIAEVQRAPIGQVWLSFRRQGGEVTGFIWALRVIPWLQGLGLGSRLVQIAEQIACAHKCSVLELGVEKHNQRARKLYERLKFKVVGDLRDEYRFTTPEGRTVKVKLDEYLMRKPLAKLQKSEEVRIDETPDPGWDRLIGRRAGALSGRGRAWGLGTTR